MKLFRVTIENYAQAVLLAIDKAGAMDKIIQQLNEYNLDVDDLYIKIEAFDVSKVIWDFE